MIKGLESLAAVAVILLFAWAVETLRDTRPALFRALWRAALAVVVIAAVALWAASAQVTGCRKIVREFHQAWGNLYDYVWSFPKAEQPHVLACLGCHAGTDPARPSKCFKR
jgi:hypothetical protein